jgi:hypothetical protein
MPKKTGLLIGFLCCFIPLAAQTALTRLADRTAEETVKLLRAPGPVLATVQFENHSFLSDLEAQTFYQLLSTRLEQKPGLVYRDLLVQFSQGKGRFNLSDETRIRYGLFVTLLETPRGLACGVAVRLLDSASLVGLVYQLVALEPGEAWAITKAVESAAVPGSLLHRRESFRIDGDIFHVSQDTQTPDVLTLCALTPENLILWQGALPNQAAGRKIPLKWSFPRSPSLQNEGRITFFKKENQSYVALGSNFSPQSIVLRISGQEYAAIGTFPFIPVKTVNMGADTFLAGSRYVPGTNGFDGDIRFLNLGAWKPGDADSVKIALRRLAPFMDMALGLLDSQFVSVAFMAGLNNRLTVVNGEWSPLVETDAAAACGANLVVVDQRWLLASGLEAPDDVLRVYDVADGGFRLLGQEKVEGQIHAMTEGVLQARPGVWILRFVSDGNKGRLSWLDFWEVNRVEK